MFRTCGIGTPWCWVLNVAFDVNGVDLRPLPLTERRWHLQDILPRGSAIVSEPLSVTGRGNKLVELMCQNDLVPNSTVVLTDWEQEWQVANLEP